MASIYKSQLPNLSFLCEIISRNIESFDRPIRAEHACSQIQLDIMYLNAHGNRIMIELDVDKS